MEGDEGGWGGGNTNVKEGMGGLTIGKKRGGGEILVKGEGRENN